MVAECLDYFNPCGNKYHTEPILFSIEGKGTNVSPAANILSKIWTVKQQAETRSGFLFLNHLVIE
jgi:hypothetical protein